jgi:hypothetical protein
LHKRLVAEQKAQIRNNGENAVLSLSTRENIAAVTGFFLSGFLQTRHDNQVDSTTQAMAWIAHGWVQDPWLELARAELEKRGKKWTGTTMVRRR